MDMDVITPIWFVSCDSRYTSISICHEMSQSFQRHENIFTDQRRTRHLNKAIFCLCSADSYHGNFPCLGYCSEPNPKCKILQLYIFRFSTVKRRRNFAKHKMIHKKDCLTIQCILPGVSSGYLKWIFRKLCQHPFNLSSCETSSISHNPLSSYYCY